MSGGALPCGTVMLQLLRGVKQARDHLSRRSVATEACPGEQGSVLLHMAAEIQGPYAQSSILSCRVFCGPSHPMFKFR